MFGLAGCVAHRSALAVLADGTLFSPKLANKQLASVAPPTTPVPSRRRDRRLDPRAVRGVTGQRVSLRNRS